MDRNSKKELKLNRQVTYDVKPPFPRTMLIELTNACNHRCVFCGYKDMTRKCMVCDTEFVRKIMFEAYENGTREIGFYMIGEPFLCNDIADYVCYAKKLGYTYIYITTNGAEATPDKLEAVINAGLDSIKFSINGATSETYFKVHGKDDYNRVKKNVVWLRNYLDDNKQFEVGMYISFIKCNYNKHETELIYTQFEKYVDNIYVFECWNQGSSMARLVEQGVVDKIMPMKMPCDMLFNELHVTVEGHLDACCGDIDGKLMVADLHKMTLKEAWNCDKFVELRKMHLEGYAENSPCRECLMLIDK